MPYREEDESQRPEERNKRKESTCVKSKVNVADSKRQTPYTGVMEPIRVQDRIDEAEPKDKQSRATGGLWQMVRGKGKGIVATNQTLVGKNRCGDEYVIKRIKREKIF